MQLVPKASLLQRGEVRRMKTTVDQQQRATVRTKSLRVSRSLQTSGLAFNRHEWSRAIFLQRKFLVEKLPQCELFWRGFLSTVPLQNFKRT